VQLKPIPSYSFAGKTYKYTKSTFLGGITKKNGHFNSFHSDGGHLGRNLEYCKMLKGATVASFGFWLSGSR